MKRSKLIVKIVVFALIVYAGVHLLTLRGRIEAQQKEFNEVRRLVADKEMSNAELEYEIEHHNDPEVIASIARANLGLVLPGEIVFYDSGGVQGTAD